MKKDLTKSNYLIGLECPLALWKVYNNPEVKELSPGDRFIMGQGDEVGKLAKQLFPGGIDLPTDFKINIEKSKEALSFGKPLFEAGFSANGCYARADILVPVDSEWDIIEVKAGTSIKEINLHDLSFQRYVYESFGLKIRNCYLMHLNKEYIRNGELELDKLFLKEDVTSDVKELSKGLEQRIKEMHDIMSAQTAPSAGMFVNTVLKNEYHDCLDACVKISPESVFHLYRGNKLALELFKDGIESIKDIPNKIKLNAQQKIQKECVLSGKSHVDRAEIENFLKQLKYPVSYLDFETFATAVPLFGGLKPYATVPFQFSLHVVRSENAQPEHFSYLYTGNADPRPEFLDVLTKNLSQAGSVVTFNAAFEKNVLKNLGEQFPAHGSWVDSVVGRVVDLLIPFRSFSYYDTQQLGSASIKRVLPALTGKDYSSLSISDGGSASAEFFRVSYTSDNKDKDTVLKNLADYCGLDTLGMVMVVDKLKKV